MESEWERSEKKPAGLNVRAPYLWALPLRGCEGLVGAVCRKVLRGLVSRRENSTPTVSVLCQAPTRALLVQQRPQLQGHVVFALPQCIQLGAYDLCVLQLSRRGGRGSRHRSNHVELRRRADGECTTCPVRPLLSRN